MPFIGTQPQVGAYSKLDAITTSATATYNLTLNSGAYYPSSANHLMVSLNGVMQAPQDSFTISGATIIFASTLASTDSIDFIMALGDVLDIGTPSDGTVVTAKIQNAAVTTAKLASSLDLSGKTVTMPAGAVLQVLNNSRGDLVTTSSTIPLDNSIPQITEGVEVFTVTITPRSAASKFYIRAYSGAVGSQTNNRQVVMALFKDSTANALATALGGFQAAGTAEMAVDLTHFMTAGTTNAITFRVRFGCNGSGSASINGNPADGQRYGGSVASGMTVMEIAG